MIGVRVRLHDMTGYDLGTADVPGPIEIGDLVALEHQEFRVYDVVETGQAYPIAAFVEGAAGTPSARRPLGQRPCWAPGRRTVCDAVPAGTEMRLSLIHI